MINKAINTIKKFQNPNGPIAGYPIFNAWAFNEDWLLNREDIYKENKQYTGLNQELTEQIDNSKTVKKPKTGLLLNNDTEGRYSKIWHRIFYNPKYNKVDLKKDEKTLMKYLKMLVHEKAHSLNRGEETPQSKQLEIYGSTDPEDYQVLQEIRWRFGINPKATLNDSDILLLKQYIQKENDPYFNEFLKRFDGRLKDILNLVADSGEKSQKDVSRAKQGIKLPLYLKYNNYEYAK